MSGVAGSRNGALERLLARAGWSPENLGDRLNEIAAEQRLGIHGHRRSPRRWIYAEPGRSAPRTPREPWPSLVCHALHERLGEVVTPAMLGWEVRGALAFVPADAGLHLAWTSAGAVAALAEVMDADVMDRRHFLAVTGMTLTSAAHHWLLDAERVAASLRGKRVDHAVVDDLERVVEAKRRMDDSIGGGTLLPSVREDLRLVVQMIGNASYTDDVGARLYRVAAEFGRLAGFLAYDSGQNAIAQRYWLAALRAAHSSGDRAVGANILGFMSGQAASTGNPRDAAVLAESALQAERQLTPAVNAMLYNRLALGAARGGDSVTWLRAQAKAEELLGRSNPDDEPPWIYWFTQAEVSGIAGVSLLELGRPAEAESHLRQAVMIIDSRFVRDRAMWMFDLATARLATGTIEHATATAIEAVTVMRRLRSTRYQTGLTQFRTAAEPFASSAAVRDFDSKCRSMVSSAST